MRNLIRVSQARACAAVVVTAMFLATPALAQSEIQSGETVADSISYPGAMVSYRFYGEARQGIVVLATETPGSNNFYPEVRLYAPGGDLEVWEHHWPVCRSLGEDWRLFSTGPSMVKDFHRT